MPNTTYRVFVEKLGASNPEEFVGNEGEIFYDPTGNVLRRSDGVTPGGIVLGGGGGSPPTPWVRPTDWLQMPTVLETEEKFVGLFAVFDTPENFIALQFTGDYTVDWGDGNIENFSSGVKAQHSYAWTDIPSGTLTSIGYRQVLVTVTPQSGQNLTTMDLSVRHDNINVNFNPSSPWLDISVSMPNASAGKSLNFVNNNNSIRLNDVQRIDIVNSGGTTNMSDMFISCYSLASVSLNNTSSVTDMKSMFNSCYSLESVSLNNTSSVTDMSNMFSSCTSLTSVPLFDTSSVNYMYNMFSGCYSLTSVPLFNTSSVTDMDSMFSTCTSLTSVPLFNTSSVNYMGVMFSNCTSLTSVPLFDASSAIFIGSSMFEYCPNLQIGALDGTSVDISYANCLLNRNSIVDIFNHLATVVSQTIDVSGNYGTADLTPTDIQIATDKGWTVTT